MRLLLDHGLDLIDLEDTLYPPKLWLEQHLISGRWSLESVTLLLNRQGKGGLPLQDLDNCLPLAIKGSDYACEHKLVNCLILLIEYGADVHATDDSGRSASTIAYSTRTRVKESRTHPSQMKRGMNLGGKTLNLSLKKLWIQALSATGYNAEEVIRADSRVYEVSDSESDGTEDQSTESDATESYQSDDDVSACNICGNHRSRLYELSGGESDGTKDQSGASDETSSGSCQIGDGIPACDECGNYGDHCICGDENNVQHTNVGFSHHDEWSLLQGDMEVWRS